MTQAVGIDIGGTKIAGALVDDDGRISERTEVPTPGEGTATILDRTAEMITALAGAADGELAGVGVACAGLVDGRRGHLWFAPNLPWQDLDVGTQLGRRTGLEVLVDNDAGAAAWGEYRFGAGRDVSDMLLATVGTGVGGGCIIDGRLVRGAFGVGAEIGHVGLDRSGPRCGCGNRGCLEVFASGTALVREARALVTSGGAKGAGLRERCDGDPAALTGSDVTDLARSGDTGAISLLADLGAHLGEGLATVCAVVDPEVIVVGGGVADAGELLIDPARAALESHLIGRGHRPSPSVVLATLGNDAGLVGVATLAREERA